MTATIVERVQAGAEYLDRVQPGWVDVIDLDRLDLASGCDCVLGQLAIDKGMAESDQSQAYLLWVAHNRLVSRVERLGFNFTSDMDDRAEQLRALTAAWRDLIVARRAEVPR